MLNTVQKCTDIDNNTVYDYFFSVQYFTAVLAIKFSKKSRSWTKIWWLINQNIFKQKVHYFTNILNIFVAAEAVVLSILLLLYLNPCSYSRTFNLAFSLLQKYSWMWSHIFALSFISTQSFIHPRVATEKKTQNIKQVNRMKWPWLDLRCEMWFSLVTTHSAMFALLQNFIFLYERYSMVHTTV